MSEALHSITSPEAWWVWASEHTLQEIGDLLRAYVRADQPKAFVGEHVTSRTLCRWASMAIEGVPLSDDVGACVMTRYGMDLYFYMWSTAEYEVEQ